MAVKSNRINSGTRRFDPTILKCDGLTFLTPGNYFDYITRKTGYPDYYKYFTNDSIDSDGLRLHLDVYEFGKNVPTLVFLPDIALYSMCYAELLYKLGQSGYNMIGLDYRGHGRSEGVRGDFTVTQLMTDVVNTVTYASERFNTNISLIGSTLGGVLAIYTATLDIRLASIICHNIADLAAPETMQLMKYPNAVKMLKSLVFRFGNPDTQIPYTAYLDDLDELKIKYFGTVKNFIKADPLVLKSISLRAIKSLASTPMPESLDKIKIPVMVMSGTNDHVFPVSYTKKIYNRLATTKNLQLFHGMNHFMMHEEAEAIVPSVLEWLKHHAKRSY